MFHVLGVRFVVTLLLVIGCLERRRWLLIIWLLVTLISVLLFLFVSIMTFLVAMDMTVTSEVLYLYWSTAFFLATIALLGLSGKYSIEKSFIKR